MQARRLDEDQLGEPYLDVELRAGDVLYIPRGTIAATSAEPSGGTTGSARPLHLSIRIHALRADEEALDVGGKPAPLAQTFARYSVGTTADRPLTARSPSPIPNSRPASTAMPQFWNEYLKHASRLVMEDPEFRCSLDYKNEATRNASREVLRPLFKRTLDAMVVRPLLCTGTHRRTVVAIGPPGCCV